MAITIYGARLSPFVRKVRVFLAEKGRPYALEEINPFAAPKDFRKISPLGRIPVLRDDEVGREGVAGTIADSSAICAYLERKFPEPRLYPQEDFAYGRALWLEEYADSDLAAHIGRGVFQPRVLWPMMGREVDEEKAAKTLAEVLPRFFGYLEAEIDDREHFVADALTIADIAVATQLVNLDHAGAKPDATRWPRLAAFRERMFERPSFATCIRGEREMLGPLARGA